MNSKAKGNAGEREAVAFLREHGFTDAKRGQQYHGGLNSPDVTGVLGWHLEIKRTEQLRLRDAVAQAEGDSRGGRWCIMHRWSHGRWLALVPAEHWLDLVRQTLPPQPISTSSPASCEADPVIEAETKDKTETETTIN